MIMKIDAVITWVDGNDPAHLEKRARYAHPGLLKADDVAGDTRFVSVGEIAWCVASLNRFASWINRIYIVTDSQDVCLEAFMNRNFPEGCIPMEIVDHKIIFRGYEEYLPTFNASAIETMTWRIPGLSDHYLSLNDDMMLCAPAQPSDFFAEDGSPICYTDMGSIPFTILTRKLKPKKDGREKVTFKGVLCNGARLAGNRWSYMKIHHTPRALRRDVYEEYFQTHPQDMIRNIQHRFRNRDMYVPEVLHYSLLKTRGQCLIRPVRGNLFYLEPKNRKGYVCSKLQKLKSDKYRFCCFNSIDKASPEDLELVMRHVEDILDITL